MEGSLIRKIILAGILFAVFILLAQSKIQFDFKCNGTDGTLTSYSYLREPRLTEDGYTRGLKTGSFNYLENGEEISFKEHISYNYGNGTQIANSSVSHELNISFDGGANGRSISKFYGTAFFPNNRAISAFKEIRYEDLRKHDNVSPVNIKKIYKTSLGKTYNASNIKVDADLSMNSAPDGWYDLKYTAWADEAVAETRDRTGWTNRTGSRRTDFEHTTLMRGGKLTIRNELSDFGPFATGPGAEADWLPCCFSSTLPAIEGLDTPWPSSGVFNTLKPDKILPNCTVTCQTLCESQICKDLKSPDECRNCSQECKNDCDWRCEENNCIGYECINTYDEGPGTFTGAVTFNRVASVFVAQYYDQTQVPIGSQPFPKNLTDVIEITYLIQVKNEGEIKLHDVVLIDTLPQRMLYNSSWYGNDSKDLLGPDPEIYLDPEVVPNDDGTTNRIRWELGEFDTGQEKVIVLKVRHNAAESQQIRSKYRENTVEASASVEGSEPLRYIGNPAQGLRHSDMVRVIQGK